MATRNVDRSPQLFKGGGVRGSGSPQQCRGGIVRSGTNKGARTTNEYSVSSWQITNTLLCPNKMKTALEQNQSTGCMIKHIARVEINRVRLSILHVVS